MHYHFSFYSSILLIFFSQGIVFSFLLLRKSILLDDLSARWLSLFILLSTLYIAPWMLGHAGWYSLQPYRDIMFYIPFQQLFLLGPVLYFYTQSLLNPHFKFTKKEIWHLLPAAAYFLFSIIVFITDKIVLNEYYFYANQKDKDLDNWYQIAGIISMSAYFIMSLRLYRLYRKLILKVSSFADTISFSWMNQYLCVFLFMQLLRIVYLLIYPDWGNFTDKWWYYFMFSFLFYYMAVAAYGNSEKSKIPFKWSGINEEIYLVSENNMVEDKIELHPETTLLPDLEKWMEKLMNLIEQEKVYKNPELTLTDVARQLQTNAAVVSKAINQGFKMNFNDFINYYRIEEVKKAFSANEHKAQTLLGIALDSGFNSKTTFNRAFKKHTGVAPNVYLKDKSKMIIIGSKL